MSSVQDKLYNYEQTPPPQVWDKITAALDESHLSDQFPSKLYNAEAIPPAHTWDIIAGALEPAQAPVVVMRSRSFAFFRYAAAAMLIGLVAFGVIKWTGGKTTKTDDSLASNDTTNRKRPVDNPVKTETPIVEPTTIVSGSTAVQSKPSIVKRARNNSYAVSDDISATEPIYAYEHTPNLADRYFMLMTPEGGIIRMSKKWGHLVCCVSGQEQDADCKDQLKKLQEKMACSPTTTSAGNFMDILSLVNTLNDSEL